MSECCYEDPLPIYLDIIHKDCDSLRKTIEKHPDMLNEISFMDGYETTPLNFAVAYSTYSVVEVLLEYKADPRIAEPSSCTPIRTAFTKKRLDIIYLLLDRVDGDKIKQVLNAPDMCQETALHYAARILISDDRRLELLKCLIKAGARPRPNVVSKLPSEMCSDIHVKKLLEDCEAKELFGYDENNIKHDKKEIEPESDNNKTLANSKDGETQLEDLIAKDGEIANPIAEPLASFPQKEAYFEKTLSDSSLNPVVAKDGNDKDNISGIFKNGGQVDSELVGDPHLAMKPRKRKMSFLAWISDLVLKPGKKKLSMPRSHSFKTACSLSTHRWESALADIPSANESQSSAIWRS